MGDTVQNHQVPEPPRYITAAEAEAEAEVN
jgi:hypothetical protein